MLRRNSDCHEKRRLALRLDPKTVVYKTNVNRSESLRFVAFGTSRTWGSDIPNPGKQAYIKLVSPSTVNLGLRATPAGYPSICLYSMIKDQVFDVAVLEFFPWKRNLEDFVRLTKRVRARFPSAVIIYLNPHIILSSVHYKRKPVKQYLRDAGLEAPSGKAFEEHVSGLPASDFKYNLLVLRCLCEVNVRAAYEEAIQAVGGHALVFPAIPDYQTNAKTFLLEGSKYFGTEPHPFDDVHLSVLGHQQIAQDLRDFLSKLPRALSSETDSGSWAAGSCLSWFTNDKFNFQQAPYANMTLAQLYPGKFSLEVDMHGGNIAVTCPFHPCQIFFNHMVHGPEHNYPRVHFEVNGQKTLVIPRTHYRYHINQLSYAGTVDVGADTITIGVTPLAADRNRSFPFRLTGIATTPLLP